MQQRLLAFLFGVIFITVSYASAAAQNVSRSWDSLNQLSAGQKIQIVEMSLKDRQGKFISYTHDTISIDVKGERINCQRDNVLRVSSRGPSKRGRNTLMGTAIGAGAGALIGYLVGANYHEEGEEGVFMLVFTPIGAGAGALIGASSPAYDYRVIYRAEHTAGQKE